MTALLIDTDVLVEYLRGRPQAVEFLESVSEDLLLSALGVSELFAGLRPGEEPALRRLLLAFRVVAVDAAIAETAGSLRRRYGPSHGTGLVDAVVAATATVAQAKLVTFNRKHFPMLEVVVPYRR